MMAARSAENPKSAPKSGAGNAWLNEPIYQAIL
jgi:hypothetical protein